jgi:hypothetical protein
VLTRGVTLYASGKDFQVLNRSGTDLLAPWVPASLEPFNGLPNSWSLDFLQELNISAEGHEILSVLWNSEGYYHFHNNPLRIPSLIKLTQLLHSFSFIKDPFQLLSSHLCLGFPRDCCSYINNHKRNDNARNFGYDRFINMYEICV